MAVLTQRLKMRSAIVHYLFSIALLASVHWDTTHSGLLVVSAEATVRTIATRSINVVEDRSRNGATRTCPTSVTLVSDGDDTYHFLDKNRDHHHTLFTRSSLPLCLKPLTTRSGVYLRTINRRQNNNAENSKRFFCWQSSSDKGTKIRNDPLAPSSKPMFRIIVASLPSTVQFTGSSPNNQHAGKQLLALKLNLLFATKKVQNNEIPLPQSIAEQFRSEQEAMGLYDGQRFSSTTEPQLPPNMELSSRAAARVDLSGRWRPMTSAQDLTDYDQFLKACCSDKISYWTRQLISSSSVVSRQELIVKQTDGGRILDMVDIHPLASSVWNRTIITKTITDDPYVNRLKGPQDNQVLIEAYWDENGTVHTSSLRMVEDEATNCDNDDSEGWLRTKLYLFETPESQKNQDDETRAMVVETTFHSTSYPTDAKAMLKAGQGDDASTAKMVWKWQEVTESSR